MEIELRNQLGALTGQVQELIKQSKNLDTTLAGALDKGSKSAGGMADSTRRTRSEMTLVEEVSHRMGRAWASQMVSLATGAVGVTALWQTVAAAMESAKKKAEDTFKATSDFNKGTNNPRIPINALPGVRAAIRGMAKGLTLEEQDKSINAFVNAGGTASEKEVGRLGQFLDKSMVLWNKDQDDLAKQYGALRKLGVTNPEDVITSLAASGKSDEIEKMKAGKALSLSQSSQGAFLKATTAARNMPTEDQRILAQRYLKAMVENKKIDSNALIKPTQEAYQEAIDAGIKPEDIPVNVTAALGGSKSDMLPTNNQMDPLQPPVAPAPLIPAVPPQAPAPWWTTVPKRQEYQAPIPVQGYVEIKNLHIPMNLGE